MIMISPRKCAALSCRVLDLKSACRIALENALLYAVVLVQLFACKAGATLALAPPSVFVGPSFNFHFFDWPSLLFIRLGKAGITGSCQSRAISLRLTNVDSKHTAHTLASMTDVEAGWSPWILYNLSTI
jgi:hypothetical protein